MWRPVQGFHPTPKDESALIVLDVPSRQGISVQKKHSQLVCSGWLAQNQLPLWDPKSWYHFWGDLPSQPLIFIILSHAHKSPSTPIYLLPSVTNRGGGALQDAPTMAVRVIRVITTEIPCIIHISIWESGQELAKEAWQGICTLHLTEKCEYRMEGVKLNLRKFVQFFRNTVFRFLYLSVVLPPRRF